MGKVDSIPVTDSFASTISKRHTNDPILIANTIKQQYNDKKTDFPRKIFGR